MAKYKVTLTKPARIYGKRLEIGEKAEVDELIYGQLTRHKAIEAHAVNVADENKDDKHEGDTNGDGYLTVEEIKALLDAKDIDYKGVRKRDDLLALLDDAEAGE